MLHRSVFVWHGYEHFYGAHVDGTGLAADEVRLIRGLSTASALIYAASESESDNLVFHKKRIEPLRA
jgi:hypothetical protein